MRTIAYIGLFWTQLDQNLPQVCIFLLGILKFGRMLAFFYTIPRHLFHL